MILYAKPDVGERLVSLFFALGGVAITLSLVGAVWAANYSHAESRAVQLASRQEARTAEPVVVTAPAGTVTRGDVPQRGVVGGVMHAGTLQTATMPLSWNDLTLMLRTGLTDDEVIAASAGKQLTVVIGPNEARQLRELGAGNRLISYLSGRPVYNAPASVPTPAANASARQAYLPQMSYVPAATPYPVVDYAVRDRQIADLKRRIDALDEDIRVIRTNPRGYKYWWYYQWNGNRVDEASLNAYIDKLDKERNDLRRQKWQLEGR